MRRFFGLRVSPRQQTDVTTRVAPLVQALLAAPRHTPRTLKQAWSKPLEDVVLKGGVTPFPLLEWEEMEVLHLPTGLFDCQCGLPFTAVLRQHTLDLAADALDHLRLRDSDSDSEESPVPSVVLSGSPGIGKTSAFPIALLRGLMRGDAGPAPPVIVVESEAAASILKLTFNVANGAVTSLKSAHIEGAFGYNEQFDNDLKTSSSVYILDTSVNGKLSALGLPARTVIITGADAEHVYSFLKRQRSASSLLVMYMRHWTVAELLAARPHMRPEVDEKTVVQRWVKLGGVPRTVFCGDNSAFECSLQETAANILRLPLRDAMLGVYADWERGRWPMVLEGHNSDVLTYVESESKSAKAPARRDFGHPDIGFLSSCVEADVLRRHRAGLIATFGDQSRTLAGSSAERAFRRLAIMLITDGGMPRVGFLGGVLQPSRSHGGAPCHGVPAISASRVFTVTQNACVRA
jgi:hypothetical protein